MDGFVLRIFDIGDSFFCPVFLEEEEGELPSPNLLEKAKTDLLEALKDRVSQKRRREYKYIGILLNTEVSELEDALKSYIKQHPQIFRDESGSDLLILHDYTHKRNILSKRVASAVYEYIERLNVPLLTLPAILLLPASAVLCDQRKPHKKSLLTRTKKSVEEGTQTWKGASNKGFASFFNDEENLGKRFLLISIKKEAEVWRGDLNEYFTLFFRSLFDAVNSANISEKDPIFHLEKKIKTNLAKQLGQSQTHKDLQRTIKERDKYSFLVRTLITAIVFPTGLYVIYVLPSVLSWMWLLEHSHKLGLQVSAVLILIGIFWTILDKNKSRKSFAFGSIFIATLVAMLQLL